MAKWNTSGALVYSGAGKIVYTDLDLTIDTGMAPTGVPNQQVFAVLNVDVVVSGSWFAARAKGDASDWFSAGNYSLGASAGISTVAPSLQSLLVVTTTNSLGVCQFKQGGVGSTNITLVGWIEATFNFEALFSGALPAAWTDEDTGIGTYGLVFTRYTKTGGTANMVAVRQNGDISDYLNTKAGDRCGGSQFNAWTNGKSYGLLTLTGGSGRYEHKAGVAVPNCDVAKLCELTDGWTRKSTVVFASAAPPISYTDLDLSAETGAVETLVFLKVSRAAGVPAPYEHLAFRPNGSAKDYLIQVATYPAGCAHLSIDVAKSAIVICETDANGIIEWTATTNTYNIELELLGFVSGNSPPTFSNKAPSGVAVSPGASITVDISDDVGVISNSILLQVTDPDLNVVNVIQSGAFQPGWTGTITANGSNGYDIAVTGHDPFIVGAWSAEIFADDVLVTATDTWGWTVIADAPIIRITDPSDGEAVFLPPANMLISVQDDWGIDTATIDLDGLSSKNEAISIISGGVFQTGFTGSIQVNGFIGVDIVIFWPDQLEKMVNWVFTISLTSIVGVDL